MKESRILILDEATGMLRLLGAEISCPDGDIDDSIRRLRD